MDYLALAVSVAAAAATVAAVWVAVRLSGRDTKERAFRQASAVTAWMGMMEPGLRSASANTIVVSNGSTAAVYDVLVSYAGAWGSAKPDSADYTDTTWLTMIPPGTWYFEGPQNPGSAMDVRPGVLMEFTDASEVRWKRAANGVLKRANRDWLYREQSENKPLNEALTRLD